MKKPGSRITIGNLEEAMKPDALRTTATEFICTLIFVFLAEGAVIFMTKLNPISNKSFSQNLSTALTHGMGLMVAVAIGINISGGHSSPAVSFGAFLGGHITFVRSVLYTIAQCLGAIAAMYLLKLATSGVTVYGWPGSTPVQATIYMIIMVFFIVYVYYGTIFDPKRGNKEIIAPLVIGFLCFANIFCGGSFFGGAMNPAMSLSIAVTTGSWNNHWMYWLGPYVGAALATVVYQTIKTSDDDIYEHLPITKPVNDEETYKQLLITKP